ncbi:MAG: lysine--tRNA ligase [Clostridia bacterium]|nr:lysine--tRNA ligase [Clostridia bacterium]
MQSDINQETVGGDDQNDEQSEELLAEQEQIRLQKLAKLREEGNDPYVKTTYEVTSDSEAVKSSFSELEGKDVSVAGRIMSRRIMGKATFCHIQDRHGLLQIYVKRDDVGEEAYASFKKDYDIGDIVGVSGFVFKTGTGEVSVHCRHIEMLTKALTPLPEKMHGLVNTDIRYRRRELDLIVNPDVKDTFVKRSQILREIRAYLDGLGYIEVDTPTLTTFEIGANARPFMTHHNALDLDMYLRIETELYLKRLIVGGLEKVYEVGRIFRNEGMDAYHNPEFTSIEMYQAYTDYFGMMDIIEDLYRTVTKNVCGSEVITYQGTEIDMGAKWPRYTMREYVKKTCGADYDAWGSDEDARASAKALGCPVPEGEKATRGNVLLALFEELCQSTLVQPTIIYDYPIENSPLAKRKKGDSLFTQRFEYFVCGQEYGNAFSELNDPIDQRERFEKQVAQKRAQDKNSNARVDEDFINALKLGLPPTGGLGFGVDRLVMLLTDSPTVRDVLLFPTMKPRK